MTKKKETEVKVAKKRDRPRKNESSHVENATVSYTLTVGKMLYMITELAKGQSLLARVIVGVCIVQFIMFLWLIHLS